MEHQRTNILVIVLAETNKFCKNHATNNGFSKRLRQLKG